MLLSSSIPLISDNSKIIKIGQIEHKDTFYDISWIVKKKSIDSDESLVNNRVPSNSWETFAVSKADDIHFVVHLSAFDVQRLAKRNRGPLSEDDQDLIVKLTNIIGLRIFLNRCLDDNAAILDGWHENINGDLVHVSNGLAHNDDDAPAVIYANGAKCWYQYGRRHREGGPAVTLDKDEEWWLNGRRHRNNGPAIVLSDGLQEWYVNGKLHREDGPAVIEEDGTKLWLIDGVFHRLDGPAVIYSDGTEIWYKDGLKHRDGGKPAVMFPNGQNQWWKNGIRYDEPGDEYEE